MKQVAGAKCSKTSEETPAFDVVSYGKLWQLGPSHHLSLIPKQAYRSQCGQATPFYHCDRGC